MFRLLLVILTIFSTHGFAYESSNETSQTEVEIEEQVIDLDMDGNFCSAYKQYDGKKACSVDCSADKSAYCVDCYSHGCTCECK